MAYSRTRNQIIIAALRNVRAAAFGQTPTPDQIQEGSDRLNDILKTLQSTSPIKVWLESWDTYALSPSSYVVGSDGNVYRCIRGHTANEASEPIVGSQWSTYWVADPKEEITATTWALETAYTSSHEFYPGEDTERVKRAFYRDGNGYDYPLEVVSVNEYMEYFDKRFESYPTTLVFRGLLEPKCFLYPMPQDTTYIIHLLREVKIEEVTGAFNAMEFPDNWIQPLIWLLSAELATPYGLNLQERGYFDNKAAVAVAKANYGETASKSIGQPRGYWE